MSNTARVTIHHREQFGDVELSRITTKLAEEVGELCSAIIRRYERRDGKTWADEIEWELGDVLTVLHALAGRVGMDLDGINAEAVDRFLARKWDIVK